jgi:hypothetical protein
MTYLQTLLMWFPACALFVAVAYVTECSWRAKDSRQGTFKGRRVLLQEDGAPLCYLDDEQ